MLLLHCASEFLQVRYSSPAPCPIQRCHIVIVEYDFEILTTLLTAIGGRNRAESDKHHFWFNKLPCHKRFYNLFQQPTSALHP